MTNERDVRDQNFVFVGGSRGLGHAAALALAERGAAVLIVARDRDAGVATVSEAKARGAISADFLAADISTVAGIRAVAESVRAWKPALHGLVHTAVAAHNRKITTADGLEFGFAVQYFARAALNRLLMDRLAASGDGRIVHLVGRPSPKVNLGDLQYETRKWSLMDSILSGHHLGVLHLQEAARRYTGQPVAFAASAVEMVKTQSLRDPATPLLFRLLYPFASAAEVSARNAVTLLTSPETANLKAVLVPRSTQFTPQPLPGDPIEAVRLWDTTTRLAQDKGLALPNL